jgi:hypothetical protein
LLSRDEQAGSDGRKGDRWLHRRQGGRFNFEDSRLKTRPVRTLVSRRWCWRDGPGRAMFPP